jgi:pimeloyl-ACP methyl ester carboxylesterase
VSFEGGYACVFWPVESEPNLVITGRGAGPIVVIGTTNDPATPLESSQKMARSLEGGVLVKVTGNGHTGYTRSTCAQKIVNRYLINGEPPSAEVECD